MRNKRLSIFLKVPAVFLSVCLMVSCINESDKEYVEVGDKIPSFTAGGPSGNISSSSLMGKKGVILLFASYCPSCQETVPVFQQLWEMMEEDDDLYICALSRQSGDENQETVASYWSEKNYTMPYYLDTDRKIYDLFAETYIPRIYVVDSSGYVTWMHTGTINITAAELLQKIQSQK